jgi:hypothetical protein
VPAWWVVAPARRPFVLHLSMRWSHR